MKRLFGRDGQVEFLKTLAKFAIVTIVVAIVLRGDVEALIETLYIEPSSLGGLALGMVGPARRRIARRLHDSRRRPISSGRGCAGAATCA